MNYKDIDWQEIYDSGYQIQNLAEQVILSQTGQRPKLTKDEISEFLGCIHESIRDIEDIIEDIEYSD